MPGTTTPLAVGGSISPVGALSVVAIGVAGTVAAVVRKPE